MPKNSSCGFIGCLGRLGTSQRTKISDSWLKMGENNNNNKKEENRTFQWFQYSCFLAYLD